MKSRLLLVMLVVTLAAAGISAAVVYSVSSSTSQKSLPLGQQTEFVSSNASSGPLPLYSSLYLFSNSNGISYDSHNGYIYVSNSYSGEITVYDPGTSRVIGNIGGQPFFGPSVYDSYNNLIYVLGPSGYILAINPSSGSLVAEIGGLNVGYSYLVDVPATTLVLDSINHNLYVKTQHRLETAVYEINTTTEKVVATNSNFDVGGAMAFSSQTNLIYVADSNGTVAELNPNSMEITGEMHFSEPSDSFFPNALLYDPYDGSLYLEIVSLTNPQQISSGVDNLFVFNASSGSVTGYYNMGSDPYDVLSNTIVYDPNGHTVFVSGGKYVWIVGSAGQTPQRISGTVSEPGELVFASTYNEIFGVFYNGIFWIYPETGNMTYYTNPVDSPSAITYDSYNSNIYAANQNSNYITVINGNTDRITGTLPGFSEQFGIISDSYNGYLAVGNYRNTYYNSIENEAVINPQNGSILHDFFSGLIATDSLNGNFFVQNGTNVSVVSWNTWDTIHTIQIYSHFYYLSFDAALNNLLVVTPGDNLLIFSCTNYSLVKTISLPSGFATSYSNDIACSADDSVVYLASSGDIVSMNITSGRVIWTGSGVRQADPVVLLYDPANHLLYAVNGDLQGVEILQASTGKPVVTQIGPWDANSLTFNPNNDGVYVSAGDVIDGGSLGVINYTYVSYNMTSLNDSLKIPVAVSEIAATAFASAVLILRKMKG